MPGMVVRQADVEGERQGSQRASGKYERIPLAYIGAAAFPPSSSYQHRQPTAIYLRFAAAAALRLSSTI